ncbi:MAG: DNA-3-methyladenine glycosylase, partial [Candidatus Cybelea sp.]
RRGVEGARDLCRGPGRLCGALAIDRTFDGIDLFSNPVLWLARDDWVPARVRRSPRIGITRAADHRLRFYLAGSPYVSGPARLSPA